MAGSKPGHDSWGRESLNESERGPRFKLLKLKTIQL